jgi:hypothetical protein
MTGVEVFLDPSCGWSWITSRWIAEVAPHRDLTVTWRSFSCEIRDDQSVPGTCSEAAIKAHAVGRRMLRIFEAARAQAGEDAVDALYAQWGRRYFAGGPATADALFDECLAACRLDADLRCAAEDESWDAPIRDAMEVAAAFCGAKTQTPTVVVAADPPHGFKGPVMASAPTGTAAVRLWDAIQVVSSEPGFFELTRPRTRFPLQGR